MGFRDALRAISPSGFKLGFTQQSTPFSANSHPGPNFPGWRWPVDDNDYRSAVQQARLSSLVEACIGYRSENAVSTPWILKERKQDGDTLTEHPVLDLLNMPNPYDDGMSALIKIWRDLDLRGNGYLLKVKSRIGDTVELWQRTSLMLRPITDKSGMLVSYQYKVQNQPAVYYLPEDVIHLRYPDPDGAPWDGRSPLEAAAVELFLDREAGKYQADSLKNGIAGLLLALASMPEDERPSADQIAAMKEYFKSELGGRNRGRPVLAEFPVTPHKIEFSPDEMRLLETHNFAEERISGIYRIPAALVQFRAGLENTTANATLKEWEEQGMARKHHPHAEPDSRAAIGATAARLPRR